MDLPTFIILCFVLGFLVLLEILFGTVTNFVIISTCLKDVLQGRTMNPVDKIMLSLSFSNMCQGLFLLAVVLKCVFSFYGENLLKVILMELSSYGVNSAAWLTSCLCIFQFIKIVHFRWRLLSLLKMKIDVLVPWMILLVELVSLGNGFINILVEVVAFLPSRRLGLTLSNRTETNLQKIDGLMYLSRFGSLAMVVLITAGTLVSLQLHIHKTSKTFGSSSNNRRPQRAVWTMGCLLVYYLLYFVTLVLAELAKLRLDSLIILYAILKYSFSPVQSLLLILGNQKYKKTLLSYLCFCCRKCGKGSSPS